MNNSKQVETNYTLLLEIFKENYPVEYWKNCCFFVEKDIEDIALHWLKFKPPDKEYYYGLAILYFVVMIVGITGNLTVIILYFRQKSLRTRANTLIINLACSDFAMMSMIPLFIYNCYHFGPALGSIGCKFYGFLGAISGTVSICLLSAISLDRYHVIKYPLSRRPGVFRVKFIVIFCWIYGAVFSLIPVLNIGLGIYVPEAYLVSCSYDYLTNDPAVRNFIFAFFVAAWVIPLFIILFSYINIIYVVIHERNMAQNSFNSFRQVKKNKKIQQEAKVAIIIFAVIILWFVAWTPYATVSLLGIFGREDLLTPLGSMIPALFCKTASCVDPYIYALTHPKFKEEIRKFFFKTPPRGGYTKPYTITSSRTDDTDRTDGIEATILVDLTNYTLQPPLYKLPTCERPLVNIRQLNTMAA